MLNKFIYRKLCKEYESTFDPDKESNSLHQKRLEALRQYLDNNGYLMPKPKYVPHRTRDIL